MRKYRVTEEHPYLKEGAILDQKGGSKDSAYFVGETAVFIAFPDMKAFESDGWIEEIQEPEFTRNDMINFADYCLEKTKAGIKAGLNFYANTTLNEWIKKYKNG